MTARVLAALPTGRRPTRAEAERIARALAEALVAQRLLTQLDPPS